MARDSIVWVMTEEPEEVTALFCTVKRGVIPDDVIQLTYVRGEMWVGVCGNGFEHPVHIAFVHMALRRDFQPRGAGTFVRRDAGAPPPP